MLGTIEIPVFTTFPSFHAIEITTESLQIASSEIVPFTSQLSYCGSRAISASGNDVFIRIEIELTLLTAQLHSA